MTDDPRQPLEYAVKLEGDFPPLGDPRLTRQATEIVASWDQQNEQHIVFVALDPALTSDPPVWERMLDPSHQVEHVVCGWQTDQAGMHGAQANRVALEIHVREQPGGGWASLVLDVPHSRQDLTAWPALLAVVLGAPVAVTTRAAVADMRREADRPADEQDPAGLQDMVSTVLPRTPVTGLAAFVVWVAGMPFAHPRWDQVPAPPGKLHASEFAVVPSMRDAEQLTRKMQTATPRPSAAIAPYLPLVHHQRLGANAAAGMFAAAHPVIIDQQLLGMLPDWDDPDHAVDFALRAPLPLPVMYLDCSDDRGRPVRIAQQDEDGATGAELPLFGAMIWRDDSGSLHVVPYGRSYENGVVCEPVLHLLYKERLSGPAPGVVLTPDEWYAAPTPGFPEQEAQQLVRAMTTWARVYGELVLSAVLLCGAQRVEVVERELSRKQRKLADRRGQQPPQEIRITPRKVPAAAQTAAGSGGHGPGKAAHWRRGHFKAFPAGTRIADAADADKLQWVPWKQAWCRLVWSSPTIVNADEDDRQVIRRARRFTA